MTEQEQRVLKICCLKPGHTLLEIAKLIGNQYQGGATKIVHRLQSRGYLTAMREPTDKGWNAL